MNIVYIVNQLRRSGPIIVLYNIIANLDRKNFTPIVIKLMHDDEDKSYTYKFKELGIEIIEFDFSFWALELTTKRVAKELDLKLSNRRIDIINTHGYHPLIVSSYMQTKAQRIDTMHNISIDSFRSSRGWLIGSYMHFRYIYRLQKIEQRVGISKTVSNYYESILKDRKKYTIYNGIDTKQFTTTCSKSELKQKLGISEYKTVFVVVGHLSALKDPEIVIKAYTSLIDKRQLLDSCLIFCGDGALIKKCKLMAHDYPMVKFTGFISNVNEYLQVADFSICASHSEGFGQNYIEALMCGCVVLSSKIPVFLEFSSYYPELKKLQFNVSNQKELAIAINNAVSNNINIDKIREDAIDRFSAVKMSRNYMQLYSQVCK